MELKKKLIFENSEEEEEETNIKQICKTNLEEEYKKLDCSNQNYYSTECNKFLLKKEFIENKCSVDDDIDSDENIKLYPNLNDSNFNIKIAEKKEFNDTKYDGKIYKNIKEHADNLSKADFELSPQQAFVKNFLSFQTPYNSLLLYHGLGSGKTCSAIGVAEEERDYMKQSGTSKRIIVVASENVQNNFKLQIFDERKLQNKNGIWGIKSCLGNKLLKEINPMNMKDFPKEKIISQIKNLINTYYLFLGYEQFANYIIKTMNYSDEDKIQFKKGEKGEKVNKIHKLKDKDKIQLNEKIIYRLRNEFSNRLIIIDEVHNIRKTDDNSNKKVAINLELLVKSVLNMRFLLLSATPMYNSYKEIIWLLNLMNTNDRRGKIEVSDIFDKNGIFKKHGKELLIQKATGYISFVRGENPYTFPYKVYPSIFSNKNTFPAIIYPSYQMNLNKISPEKKNRILSLYLNTINNCVNEDGKLCGNCQYCIYKYIIYNLRNQTFSVTTKKGTIRNMPTFSNMESFGYTLLQIPLESLIISYPIKGLQKNLENIPKEEYLEIVSDDFEEENKEEKEQKEIPGIIEIEKNSEESSELIQSDVILNDSKILKNSNEEESDEDEEDEEKSDKKENTKYNINPDILTGKKGLKRIMDFKNTKSPFAKGDFEYKKSIIDTYGKIFSYDIIGNYSSKIKCILDNIKNLSEGIILIYSQYIDGGLIPMALALEELGFIRFGKDTNNLFKKTTPARVVVDVRTIQPSDKKSTFMPARYSMITGDPRLSPNNEFEVKGLTNENNKDGHKIKIVLVSKAGSEGIDLKYIRQVHILEPWYNMNRIDQIIGRAVRNFSHKDLEFEKRNVQIFMHGTILGKENEEEAADLYVYRVAELKAIQIGKISRILKETAVDCIINHDQTNFTQDIMLKHLDEPIQQELSNGIILDDFKVGDAPFSSTCDYMSSCNYSCSPNKEIPEEDLNKDTYNEKFIVLNSEKILEKIRMLMKQQFFYKKDILINAIRTPKKYPILQIYSALTQLIEDNNEFIIDKFGRTGRLINIGDYYLFQPSELKYNNISIFDRSVPIDYKHDMINFNINIPIKEKKRKEEEEEEEEEEEKEEKKKEEKEEKVLKQIDKESDVIEQIDDNALEKDKKEGEKRNEKEEEKTQKRKKKEKTIIDEIKINFNITLDYYHTPITYNEKNEVITGHLRVDRGDDNWYKHYGIVIKNMQKDNEYNEIPENNYIEFLVDHIIENLLFNEKVELINKLYFLNEIEENTFEWFAKMYFSNQIMIVDDKQYIILYNLNEQKIIILNKKKWIEALPEDKTDLIQSKNIDIKKKLDILHLYKEGNYNNIIGFIGYEKNNNSLTYKTKNLSSKRDTGAKCDDAGIKTMTLLNEILGKDKYTKENTKLQKDSITGEIITFAITHTELCVIQEIILRYYNKIQKNGKGWFLTPEMAIYYKVYTVNVKL